MARRRSSAGSCSGDIFDARQLPVITILAGVGTLVTLRRWRTDPVGRAILAFFLASLVLYCGRPTFGLLIDRLPGQETLFLHRMIIGVHLGGIWLGRHRRGRLGQAALAHRPGTGSAAGARAPRWSPGVAWLGAAVVLVAA